MAENFKMFRNFPLSCLVILGLMGVNGVFAGEQIPINVRQMPPHITVSGTHEECGEQIGEKLKDKFQDFVNNYDGLNKVMIPAYNTEKGKQVYDEILAAVTKNYPQYVEELQAQAKGSGVEFYKLFLLNIETPYTKETQTKGDPTLSCSDVGVHRKDVIMMGHNEDVDPTLVNHVYLVTAEITNPDKKGKWKKEKESFTAFSYVGYLPGYAFGFNEYGLVNSINTIQADTVYGTKTPRMFLCRAALSAESFEDLQTILADDGTGAGEAVSMNFAFHEKDKETVLHNVEVGPPLTAQETKSRLDWTDDTKSEGNLYHFNSFQRLKDTTKWDPSSTARFETYKKLGVPQTKEDILNFLGDTSGGEYKVHKEPGTTDYTGVSVVTALFDFLQNTLTIYSGDPKDAKTETMVVDMKYSLAA